MDWDFFWAWTGDDVVWSWVRTASAALFGAVAGGAFTLLGQARQAKSQQALQTIQLDAEAERTNARWERDRLDSAHRDSLGAAHELFEGFTAVQRSIQAERASLGDIVSGASWGPKWKRIWTADVSLDLDVGARLIVDDVARGEVQRIVTLLDQVSDVTADSQNYGALNMGLQEAAGHLSAEAIEVIGAYLRRVNHKSDRGEFMTALEKARIKYGEWEDYEVERQIAAAEAAGNEAEEPDGALADHDEPDEGAGSTKPMTPPPPVPDYSPRDSAV